MGSPSSGRTQSLSKVSALLLAVLSNLQQQGDAVVAPSLEALFSTSRFDAMSCYQLFYEALVEHARIALPVYEDDTTQEFVLCSNTVSTRRFMRLTKDEYRVLFLLVDGLPEHQQPLATCLLKALAPLEQSETEDITDKHDLHTAPSLETERIQTILQVHSEHQALRFLYAKQDDPLSQTTTRVVVPRSLTRFGDYMLLNAFDLDRQADRSFRLDRMQDLKASPLPTGTRAATRATSSSDTSKRAGNLSAPGNSINYPVRLVLHDAQYLDYFSDVARSMEPARGPHASGTVIELPFIDSIIIRRLAALPPDVIRIDDEKTKNAVHAYKHTLCEMFEQAHQC